MLTTLTGVGIGLRRKHIPELKQLKPGLIDFFEIAPENWMKVGGKRAKNFAYFRKHYPLICHGLSLSIGSPAPLNSTFLNDLKAFLKQHQITIYTEHLSYCSDQGQLYDLLPIPFTEEAVHYVAKRIAKVQDLLGHRVGFENISYYCAPGQEMTEVEFINAVIAEADCDLLLDVNNIYVNSVNHHYDAKQFLQQLKPKHISYIHIAGHNQHSTKLLIDTHGESVTHPVWELLELAYRHFGILPTLLERDNNLPPLSDILQEVQHIRQIQHKVQSLETMHE